MAGDHDEGAPRGVLDALLMPLLLPGRVAGNVHTLTEAVLSLQSDARRRLGSIDARAGELVEDLREVSGAVKQVQGSVDTLEQERMDTLLEAIGRLQGSIDRIETRIEDLESLEANITDRLDGVRADLNERMLAIQHEVERLQPPMREIARDVQQIDQLLPDGKDGPLTRLKDTLSAS